LKKAGTEKVLTKLLEQISEESLQLNADFIVSLLGVIGHFSPKESMGKGGFASEISSPGLGTHEEFFGPTLSEVLLKRRVVGTGELKFK